jgi:hypothetical protein
VARLRLPREAGYRSLRRRGNKLVDTPVLVTTPALELNFPRLHRPRTSSGNYHPSKSHTGRLSQHGLSLSRTHGRIARHNMEIVCGRAGNPRQRRVFRLPQRQDFYAGFVALWLTFPGPAKDPRSALQVTTIKSSTNARQGGVPAFCVQGAFASAGLCQIPTNDWLR